MLCAPNYRRRPFSYHRKMADLEYFLVLSEKAALLSSGNYFRRRQSWDSHRWLEYSTALNTDPQKHSKPNCTTYKYNLQQSTVLVLNFWDSQCGYLSHSTSPRSGSWDSLPRSTLPRTGDLILSTVFGPRQKTTSATLLMTKATESICEEIWRWDL